MIVQNNSSSHATKAEHVGVVGVEPLVGNHVLADRGHQSQGSGQVILRNRAVLGQKVGGGLVDDVHHGGRVREEEGHAVGQLILDGDLTVVLLGQLHAVQSTTVVGEIVLDGRVQHLQIIKSQNKVKNISKLLSQSLSLLQVGLRIILAKSGKKLGEALVQLLRVVVEFLQLLDSGEDSQPSLILSFRARVCDSFTNVLFTTSVVGQFFEDLRGTIKNLSNSIIDGSLLISLWLSFLKVQEKINRVVLLPTTNRQ
mmetsp:Transcript_3767/g.5761  ORF Transcript_3767/g.5761 Transcript_3767/m.5761 type:complete len:255 (-) Transcript_3767:123-887(-)